MGSKERNSKMEQAYTEGGVSMNKTFSESTEKLISILGRGKKHAISRAELGAKMGLCDRSTREAVCLARLEGACIANEQDGEGYYIPASMDEYKRQYRQTEHRGKKILAQLKGLRERMAEMADEHQLSLFDKASSEIEQGLEQLGELFA